MWIGELAVTILGVYTLLGLAFAAVFATLGVSRIDPAARGASLAFRLIIVPGAIAFWPLLAGLWIRNRQ